MRTHIYYNSLLWGFGAIALGLLLIFNHENVIPVAIKLIGILSLTIGLVQVIIQLFQNRKSEHKQFPIGGIISAVWGTLLLVRPMFWVELIEILFGLVMIFLALAEISAYYRLHKSGVVVSWAYFIFPVLLSIAGIVTIIKPEFLMSSLVIFVASWLLAYGVIEVISYFALKKAASEQKKIKE